MADQDVERVEAKKAAAVTRERMRRQWHRAVPNPMGHLVGATGEGDGQVLYDFWFRERYSAAQPFTLARVLAGNDMAEVRTWIG
ncbi:MAG TPA: hypothetical protein VK741_21770 [Acetobacteraceae bacterium]|jgi:hypothetical protein|nr:hypothetical protein [Acetobacteraceae bacterium]